MDSHDPAQHSLYDSDPAESSSSAMASRHRPTSPREDDEEAGEENVFRYMTFEEILEDLSARFLNNLPQEEIEPVRAYWAAEQAHWFYEDYIRPLKPQLPVLGQKNFSQLLISQSPLAHELGGTGGVDYDAVWAEYCDYKKMVPVCGGILINKSGDKCLMVRGWKENAGWSFPRGKINSAESDVACAIREVEEETGFDLTGLINPADNIQTQISAQSVTMFIVKDIDESTVFETQTRNEIGAIEWVKLTDLPTWTGRRGPKATGGKGQKKFYNVTPFVGPLKRWLTERGMNPNSKPRKGTKNQDTTDTAFRDLQPYQFDPVAPDPKPIHPEARQHSALDDLFTRFVRGQNEMLRAPSVVNGGDNREGMRRLLGTMHTRTGQMPLGGMDPLQEEDDVLARLLGTVSVASTSDDAPQAPATAKQNKLLSMLNQSPARTGTPQSSGSRPNASTHQASLLQVLTPTNEGSRQIAVQSSLHSDSRVQSQAATPAPNTGDSANLSVDEERRRKQISLLEMTAAGAARDAARGPERAPSKPSPREQNSLGFSPGHIPQRVSPPSQAPVVPTTFALPARPPPQAPPMLRPMSMPHPYTGSQQHTLPSPPNLAIPPPPAYDDHFFHPGQQNNLPGPLRPPIPNSERQQNLLNALHGAGSRPPSLPNPPMMHAQFHHTYGMQQPANRPAVMPGNGSTLAQQGAMQGIYHPPAFVPPAQPFPMQHGFPPQPHLNSGPNSLSGFPNVTGQAPRLPTGLVPGSGPMGSYQSSMQGPPSSYHAPMQSGQYQPQPTMSFAGGNGMRTSPNKPLGPSASIHHPAPRPPPGSAQLLAMMNSGQR